MRSLQLDKNRSRKWQPDPREETCNALTKADRDDRIPQGPIATPSSPPQSPGSSPQRQQGLPLRSQDPLQSRRWMRLDSATFDDSPTGSPDRSSSVPFSASIPHPLMPDAARSRPAGTDAMQGSIRPVRPLGCEPMMRPSLRDETLPTTMPMMPRRPPERRQWQ